MSNTSNTHSIRVDISAHLYPEGDEEVPDIQSVLGKIILYGDEEDEIQAGTILGYRITCSNPHDVIYLADHISQDFFDATQFLPEHEEDFTIYQPALYIDQVILDPQWRGGDLALTATALYIRFLADEGFIFFSPAPPGMPDSPERAHQIKRLRRFWRKLNVNHYNPQYNIMWQPEWTCYAWHRKHSRQQKQRSHLHLIWDAES